MKIEIFVPGTPVPFARAGANGKRRYTPPRQAGHMALILNHAIDTYKGPPLTGPLQVRLQFVYAWPKSWKEERRRESGAHLKISVPDIDNLSKLALDALQPEVIEDDSTVCRLEAWKQYGLREGTTIYIETWEWQ